MLERLSLDLVANVDDDGLTRIATDPIASPLLQVLNLSTVFSLSYLLSLL